MADAQTSAAGGAAGAVGKVIFDLRFSPERFFRFYQDRMRLITCYNEIVSEMASTKSS